MAIYAAMTAPAEKSMVIQTSPPDASFLPVAEGAVIAAAIAVLIRSIGPMFVNSWLNNASKRIDAEVETDKMLLNALITTLARQQAANQEHVNNMLAQSGQSYQLIATMLKQNSDAIDSVASSLQAIASQQAEQFSRINSELAKLIEANKLGHMPVKELSQYIDKLS